MNSTITAIIFDFGNVFVKWDVYAVYNRFFPNPQAVDSFLEEIHFAEWNEHQDAGRPFKEGVAELSAQYPQYADLIQAYDTYWEDSITEVYHGTVEILRRLKKEGWPLYLLSNFSGEKFPIMEQRYDFIKLFDDVIISGDHKLVKPDPAIFQVALEKFKLNPHTCLFIDDSLPNIETARSLGFHTIQFHSPEQLERDLGIW